MRKIIHDALLIGIAVMAVLVMVFLFRMEARLNAMKLMRNQLQSLRISVNLYRVIEGKNPSSVEDLVRSEYGFPGERERRRFVDSSMVDSKGGVLDPFGNPFSIDPRGGWVRSTSPGYEFW